METLAIEGPTPLRGEIEVAGAKNSVSKLLTASMLTAEPCRFLNVPAIGDMEITKRICQALGAHCTEGAAKQLDGIGESMKGLQGGYASGRAANSMNQWG